MRVLSEVGSDVANRKRCSSDHRHDAGKADRFGFGLADINSEVLDHVSRLVLLVGADVGGGVDRSGGHSGLVEQLECLVAVMADGPLTARRGEVPAAPPAARGAPRGGGL